MKTFTPTSILKNILKNKPLSFYIGGNIAGNYITNSYKRKLPFDIPYNLNITVYPKNKEGKHDVFINGIESKKLLNKPSLSKYWYKTPEEIDKSIFWQAFLEDWNYLLGLDLTNPKLEGTNFLYSYIRGTLPIVRHTIKTGINKVKHKYNYKKHYDYKHPESLVCVKDLVTKEIIRVPRSRAIILMQGGPHLKYCKKYEWRTSINNELALKYGIKKKEQKLSNYWEDLDLEKEKEKVVIEKVIKGNKEYNKYSIHPITYKPKNTFEKPRPRYFKVVNGKAIKIERTKLQIKSVPTYDRHAKLQQITIHPPLENICYEKDRNGILYEIGEIKQEEKTITNIVPKLVYIPIYGKSAHNKNILFKYKKIFVENTYNDVTFVRDMRTTYKTIITKQYPSILSKRRHIIKKNMELLRQQEEKQKQQEQQVKSE